MRDLTSAISSTPLSRASDDSDSDSDSDSDNHEASGGQGRAGQGRAGQGRAGQGRAGQGRAGEGRAGEGRAGEGRGREADTYPTTRTRLASAMYSLKLVPMRERQNTTTPMLCEGSGTCDISVYCAVKSNNVKMMI